MILTVNTATKHYDVVIERGVIGRAGELLDFNRKVLVVTDSGVPLAYPESIARQAKEACIVCFPSGEKSKNTKTWRSILDRLVEYNFTRSDCIVAVGGGVVGDLAGFAASSYLRGIDFYNIPTTLLAQLDSSVGGKVGMDYKGYKNLVGSFYQPKKVLIDPDALNTLEPRQLYAGAAEAVKVGLTRDKALFDLFESGRWQENIETVIYRALAAKAEIVSADETETGLRRVLNFGHTVGHAVETACGYALLHGECVALGMLPMVSDALRPRLLAVLQSLELPTVYKGNTEQVLVAMMHDKKCSGDNITVVRCEEVGSYVFQTVELSRLLKDMRRILA